MLIYDPKVTDGPMIELLERQARAGVDVRILGSLKGASKYPVLRVQPYCGKRLHVRALIRDRAQAFVGSQSLRAVELDARREVGICVRERALVRRLGSTFDADWALTPSATVAPRELDDGEPFPRTSGSVSPRV